MTGSKHERTARLPCGYRVTFKYAPDRGTWVEWSGWPPRIASTRAWRRFLAAYRAERDAFAREIATMIGGTVLDGGRGWWWPLRRHRDQTGGGALMRTRVCGANRSDRAACRDRRPQFQFSHGGG